MIITKRQRQALKFISDFVKENRINPTHQEIADEMEYINRQSATNIIDALCRKEYLAKTMMDRRNVVITNKGRELLNRMKAR